MLFAYVTHFASLIINMGSISNSTYIYRKGECIMLRLSDHAIKMMEQRLRIEKQRTYQANKVVDNLHHKYFFQHIFQPKR